MEDMNTPNKQSRAANSQDQSSLSNTMPYPEWPGDTLKAYFNSGKTQLPPAYFASTMASSSQAHPYVWGPQHLVSPYGATAPCVPVYSPGAMYNHPSMLPGANPYGSYGMLTGSFDEATPGALAAANEGEAKCFEARHKGPSKNSKVCSGSTNNIVGKATKNRKGITVSGAASQGRESGKDGSSDESSKNSLNDSQSRQQSCFDGRSLEVDRSQNGNGVILNPSGRDDSQGATSGKISSAIATSVVPVIPVSLPFTSPMKSGPVTDVNTGISFGNGISVVPTLMHGKHPGASASTEVNNQNVPSIGSQDLSIQILDERERKRQRRKESNRESARRSRLRKQAECEELQRQSARLKEENEMIRAELALMRGQREKLSSENDSLKGQLQALLADQ
eukprot:TRINITY_DN8094_c0_g1_i1.p1 TRINITY_DN8094_c0_g1~~TRINITY_DN8094_c0_g1_i1.p1  ORF type:complete len:393 (-),score=107.78 TRINITY_DN8094_c0_g1_i1:572-1750(-)